MSSAQRHATAPRPHRPRVAPRACVTTAGRSSAVRYSVATPAPPATGVVPDAPARTATHGVDAPGHERPVTVMFTDIEDSSTLVERLGDRRWLEVYTRHSALVHRNVARHRGVVVKGQGDGFMAAFADPAAAVECAVALQRDLAAAPAGEETLRVRIGLHTGVAIRRGGDFHGRTVVIAARISAQARGGEILVSADVARAVRRAGAVTVVARGAVALKGLDGRHAIYAAEWAPRRAVAVAGRPAASAPRRVARVEFRPAAARRPAPNPLFVAAPRRPICGPGWRSTSHSASGTARTRGGASPSVYGTTAGATTWWSSGCLTAGCRSPSRSRAPSTLPSRCSWCAGSAPPAARASPSARSRPVEPAS